MYSLSNRPNKILAKTRRGLTQKLDNLDKEYPGKKSVDHGVTADMSSPKPVFHQVNGRRTHYQKNSQETITPQQEEIIRYIHENWKLVCREYETCKPVDGKSEAGQKTTTYSGQDSRATSTLNRLKKVPNVVYYQEKSTNILPNFEPFDLESFWGQRLFQNITQSS